MFAPAAQAQYIYQRVAYKYILDGNGQRPPGPYRDQAKLQRVIDATNRMLDRFGRGYRFQFEPSSDVAGATQFYDLTQSEFDNQLRSTAQANPVQYHWRTDAFNVYIVNSAPWGGAAEIPNYTLPTGDVMEWVCSNDTVYNDIRMIHEMGHHDGLFHTFETQGKGFFGDCPNDDCVGDTRFDPELSCTGAFSCTVGGGAECCCATKLQLLNAKAANEGWTQAEYDAIRWNVMGYFGANDCVDPPISAPFTFDNMLLTSGQLDRLADATRLYHAGEVTGYTYFVDGSQNIASPNGYSALPYKTVLAGVNAATLAGTTHIVNIRAGLYPELVRLNQRVTLRASRGTARIGP
jgi:hypothetical protein